MYRSRVCARTNFVRSLRVEINFHSVVTRTAGLPNTFPPSMPEGKPTAQNHGLKPRPSFWDWLPASLQARLHVNKPPADECHDIEAQRDQTNARPWCTRFTYSPKSKIERLLVMARLKNSIDRSRIIRIPFNKLYKFVLLGLLLLLAILLTPSLLPNWLGFEWATVRHLCQNSDEKLRVIEGQLANYTQVQNATKFLNIQQLNMRCMNESAEDFYHGPDNTPPRFLWPRECTPDLAQTSLTETQCHKQEANVCSAVGGITGFFVSLGGNCVRTVGPELCVEKTDVERAEALLELQKMRNMASLQGNTSVMLEPIAATANERLEHVMSRTLTKVDFAADAFLLYSLLSISVGVPLIIYRREKGSTVVTATFGLTKLWFIVLVVSILTIYDSASLIVQETDFPRLFRNFMRDPCYVDPVFSARRVALITQACTEIASISAMSDVTLQTMDSVYYDVRLFGHCKDDERELAPHPRLTTFDDLRSAYRQGNLSNPGRCNATELNELTSVAPQDNEARWQALFGSGVIAQLLLKFILTSWLLHVFSYLEPLVLHNGKVEIWGHGEDRELSPEETDSVCRFARDKHLVALWFFSALLIAEIVLILYSVMVSGGHIETLADAHGGSALPVEANVTGTNGLSLSCPPFLMLE